MRTWSRGAGRARAHRRPRRRRTTTRRRGDRVDPRHGRCRGLHPRPPAQGEQGHGRPHRRPAWAARDPGRRRAGPVGQVVDYKNCFDPFWGRFRSRTRPVPGNHDYLAAGAKGYFDYWGSQGGARGQGYYAWQAGGWRIYALNSNCSATGGCGEGSPMYRWLRDQLASSSGTCQLRVLPPRPVVAGHSMAPTRRCRRSTTSSTAPAPSSSCRDTTTPTSGSPPSIRAASATPPASCRSSRARVGLRTTDSPARGRRRSVKNNTTFGVVALDLSDSSWSLRFVPEAGKSFRDSSGGQCRGPNGSL